MNLLTPAGTTVEPCPSCGRPMRFTIFADAHPTDPATIVLRAETDHTCPSRTSVPNSGTIAA